MPDFSILSTPNFGQAALAGFHAGQEQRRDRDTQVALRGYVANPDDPAALAGLAVNAPQVGLPLLKDHREQAEKAAVGDLAARAAQGDATAARELWRRDPALATKFEAHHQEMLKNGMEAIGNAALRLSVLNDADIPAAADQAIDQLSERFPELAKFKGRVRTRADLDSVLDQTGMSEKAMELRSPKYQVAPPGGGLINTNPNSPGFRDGATANTHAPIQPGAVVNGKTFRGGDYRDPANWEAGGAGSDPRTFP